MLATTKKTVGLAIGNTQHEFSMASALIADGVQKHASQEAWDIIDLRSWHWCIPDNTRIDGLILDNDAAKTDRGNCLSSAAPHSVQIKPEWNLSAVRGVGMDAKALGQMAADYFIERGFRSFGLAAYQTDEWTDRLTAFKERIEQSGGQCLAIHGMHMPDNDGIVSVHESVKKQLRELSYPLGIFCANDRLALRLCRWCIEEGIAVPEQAAILGYGNDTIACRNSSVPLSSISPDNERYGIEAAKLLQRMMDGENIPKGTIVRIPPKEIITRRSTDIMAITDPVAASALRYIWDHYGKPISPSDVADFCGLSRRMLDRRFKKAIGRTLMQEVMRRRLSEARELLVTGDLSSVDIAAFCSFGTPQYFNYQFKKKFGVTPQTYRERERGNA